MSRWSKPFVSAGVLVLLAACHTTSRDEDQAPKLYVVRPTADGSVRADAAVPNNAAPPAEKAPAPASVTPAAAPTSPKAAAVAISPAAPAPPAVSAKAVYIGTPAATGVAVPEPAARQFADALKAMKAGQASEAELQFKQIAAAYPDLTGPQLNLGLLYLQSARLTEAETAFKAALERNPASAVAGNELGIVERKLGKFTDAEAAYQRSIAAEPNYAPAYLNLGMLYDLYLAEPQKALEQFEHYTQLAGDSKQVAGWVAELRKRVAAPAPPAKKDPA